MRKLWNGLRSILAVVLVCSLTFGLCYNGLEARAIESSSLDQKEDILKDFFGDDTTPEEAYEFLLTESAKMETYENQTFQYVPNEDSYYVALGDETAANANRQKVSYVNMLGDALDISYKNLASVQQTVQEVYATISDNSKEIKKADLITIGFSNYGATFAMCKYMGSTGSAKVTEQDWIDLVGEEHLPKVEAVMDEIFKKMAEKNVTSDKFGSYDLEGGLEWYVYTYMSNAIHMGQVIEAIREINTSAAIVLVGTYNDVEGVVLNVDGSSMDLGGMMNDLVNSSNYLALKTSEYYDRVAYVDARDVSTTLDANLSRYTSPENYITAIAMRQGLPTSDGHTYIKDQILACMSATCRHPWNKGEELKAPTCSETGTMKYTCTWCGETKQEEIPATANHTPTTREENRKEATCDQDGGYDVVTFCADCGVELNRQHHIIAATGHSFGQWTETKAPTCTEAGEESRVCANCGLIEKRSLDAIGHNYVSEVIEPTCTEGGYTKHTCSHCGDSYITDETAPLNHNWDGGVVTKEPTTTEEGEMTYTCLICGATRTEKLPKLDPGPGPDPDVLMGDVNGDGRINARDARAILRYIAGLTGEGEINVDVADVNGDGRINARDARALLRQIAGLD